MASRGLAHANRSYNRSFSLNIFKANAAELTEIVLRVSHPDEGLRFMSQENREAGVQMHREVARRLHNFVAAAKTLVEHTRNFMRECYSDTSLYQVYQQRVKEEFSDSPLGHFVQDLRNYMLHKGLPNSEMFLHFSQDPNEPDKGAQLKTGIRYPSSSLTEWNGWTALARKFINGGGDFVEILDFSKLYAKKVESFHTWLQNELDLFHAADIAATATLQKALRNLEGASISSVRPPDSIPLTDVYEPSIDNNPVAEFEIKNADEINEEGRKLLSQIQKMEFPDSRTRTFETERANVIEIRNSELAKEPILRGANKDGKFVVSFIRVDGFHFGLDEIGFGNLLDLAEKISSAGWPSHYLSRSFIENSLIDWLRDSFKNVSKSELARRISTESELSVQELELWAPIAHLEVEVKFDFGPVQIAPISKSFLDQLREKVLSHPNLDTNQTNSLFDMITKEIQGFAAVVIKMKAEQERIQEEGDSIARDAVALLQFLSPASSASSYVNATALLGRDTIQSSKLMVFGKNSFSYSTKVIPKNLFFWRIAENDLSSLRASGLDQVGKLVSPVGLSPLQLAVRSSLILFGTASTLGSRLIISTKRPRLPDRSMQQN